MVAAALLDVPRERHRALLTAVAREEERRWTERRGILKFMAFTADDVDRAFSIGRDSLDPIFGNDPWQFYTPEAAADRAASWQEEADDGISLFTPNNGYQEPAHTTYVRQIRKVGRNEPCPCGSGKKYKRCCLGKSKVGAA